MRFPFELPERRAFDAVGFGTNAVDFLISVPEYPAFNSKVELNSYVQAPGGEVASTMVGLQRLGLKAAYMGRFGDDDAGRLGIASLRDEGVDLGYAETIENARTQIAFIVIDARNGERTVIWQRDARLHYTADEVMPNAAVAGRVLHITPHDTSAAIRLAAEARRAGTIVSIDIDNIFESIDELLPLVDVLIASADLPSRLTGIDDRHEALRTLIEKFGCSVAGVTLGSEGSLVLGPEGFIETPSFSVPGGCMDTTGSGDAFRAGFLYGILSNATIEESCKYANAVAALKCRKIGARTSLPDEKELHDLVKIPRQ
ncbi:MAG TPA: carbohydrate kinase family protein [Pyrinomonadaceae bacterium]|nr:carbohydrate kinase family protein [Pyrinomonadaceae bacterium]